MKLNFNFYFFYNISKEQLYRIGGSEFYEWLFGTFEKRAPERDWNPDIPHGDPVLSELITPKHAL